MNWLMSSHHTKILQIASRIPFCLLCQDRNVEFRSQVFSFENNIEDLLSVFSSGQINKQSPVQTTKDSVIKIHGSVRGSQHQHTLCLTSSETIPIDHELVFDLPHCFMLSLTFTFAQDAVHLINKDHSGCNL